MLNKQYFLFCFLFFVIFLCHICGICGAVDENETVFIVYMGSLPEQIDYSPTSEHRSLLEEVVGYSGVEKSLIRSFKRSFNGFAAKLTNAEKDKLASMGGVVSVFPSVTYHLQTTRSWDYMGLNDKAKRQPNVESDTIIGLLDGGIWPESESFNDKGFGPAPKKWKGGCKGGTNFTCNNKIIGARYYTNDSSARDEDGHGTHTSSTAAGNRVIGTSFYGYANGTAKGGVPSARIAAYKVCDSDGCTSEAMLAAFDDAIADGVDLISISITVPGAITFSSEPVAIGSFHAIAKGILTINSAGNNGPYSSSINSLAPWLLTVAASTTDRLIVDKVVLGNGMTLVGSSINTFSLNGTKYPLISSASASQDKHECGGEVSGQCDSECLDEKKVKGKILFCNSSSASGMAYAAGAVGSIGLESYANISDIEPFPASALSGEHFDVVAAYIKSEKNPTAEILKSETIKDDFAPMVAQFSSRGPNTVAPDILKPDLTAPGVNILAAYSPVPAIDESDRHVKYNLMSGTSMACPQVSAIAAYVKTFHPDWSPSAIKSALMTTARPMDASRHEDAEFAYGSGHVDPIKSIDPGLVYDALKHDYVQFLCGFGYDDNAIRKISGEKNNCPKGSNTTSPRDLNYPTMSFKVSKVGPLNVTFHRTVTNVGTKDSIYKVKVTQNAKLNVVVEPKVLTFKSLNEKKSFIVTVTGELSSKTHVSASLEWSDGIHNVRSPIVLYKD